jgi:hypothetical protein
MPRNRLCLILPASAVTILRVSINAAFVTAHDVLYPTTHENYSTPLASRVAYNGRGSPTTDKGVKMNGTLDVEKSSAGYRWVYTSANGAMHLSGGIFRTKKAALTAGEHWMKERNV